MEASLLWKNAQKKEKKNKTYERINIPSISSLNVLPAALENHGGKKNVHKQYSPVGKLGTS